MLLSIANTIKVAFPKARHLLCTWHIANNVTTHIVSLLY